MNDFKPKLKFIHIAKCVKTSSIFDQVPNKIKYEAVSNIYTKYCKFVQKTQD